MKGIPFKRITRQESKRSKIAEKGEKAKKNSTKLFGAWDLS